MTTTGADQVETDTTKTKRTVVGVTGDVGVECNVYLPGPAGGVAAAIPTRLVKSWSGAAVVNRLLTEVGRTGGFDVKFVVDGNCGMARTAPALAALWEPAKGGRWVKTPDAGVWRMSRSLMLGEAPDLEQVAAPAEGPSAVATEGEVDVLVVDDRSGDFRAGPPRCAWPVALAALGGARRPWVVLRTTAPLCQGELWYQLAGAAGDGEKLIVLLTVGDLRRADARVSRAVSWERTAADVAREVVQCPELEGLREAAHVVVTLETEGAVWVRRTAPGQFEAEVIFDAQHMEGEWAEAVGVAGEAYGLMSCVVCGVAAAVAESAGAGERPDIRRGMTRGLRAARLLRLVGHGAVGGAGVPGMPVADLARVLGGLEPGAADEVKVEGKRLGTFAQATVPSGEWKQDETANGAAASRWRIVEGTDTARPAWEPLYGAGRRLAVYGLRSLSDAPYARFGKLVTADRDEIEALRNLKRLMQEYRAHDEETKPLSIGVFGPPGAGKSFGVKQIAKEVLKDECFVLEFNLSQFADERDLIGAFHQVRDKALEGKLPVVFWDEFDSQRYRWLQFLLAPMQDGRFQEGQITHPIGRSIFVFAGATSYDLANFGPPAGDREAVADFRLKKGPDFASRLHGYLNVLGPNRRQLSRVSDDGREREWVEDPTDVCFPIRRALLLRSMLGRVGDRENERLEIDPGLLAALLEVDRYTHGARSMEKIVQNLARGGERVVRRSALPPDELLGMNLNLTRFRQILERARRFQGLAGTLAPAIHDDWRERKTKAKGGGGFPNDKPFDELSADVRASNVAAALRMPRILELAGLYLVPSEKDSVWAEEDKQSVRRELRRLIELLAEEEHVLWMEVMFANGWRAPDAEMSGWDDGQLRAARRHKCMVPYAQLDRGTKDYDRDQVLRFPEHAGRAGFRIVVELPG